MLFTVMGYKQKITVEQPNKFIIALAPHTSNWDFMLGILYSHAMGFKCEFMMKKEWFFWPLGYIMRGLGGIPVTRNKRCSTTDQLAKVAKESKTFHLCITPEGTRKPNAEWKKGFYYIALKADIPILLYGLDYERKYIECSKIIVPTGNVESEMKDIKLYFSQFKGKHPEKFKI